MEANDMSGVSQQDNEVLFVILYCVHFTRLMKLVLLFTMQRTSKTDLIVCFHTVNKLAAGLINGGHRFKIIDKLTSREAKIFLQSKLL